MLPAASTARPKRIVEARRSARAVGATGRTRHTGQCRHDPIDADFADRAVVGVGHIDVARRVDRDALGQVEERGCAVRAARDAGGAGQGGHGAARRDLRIL